MEMIEIKKRKDSEAENRQIQMLKMLRGIVRSNTEHQELKSPVSTPRRVLLIAVSTLILARILPTRSKWYDWSAHWVWYRL